MSPIQVTVKLFKNTFDENIINQIQRQKAPLGRNAAGRRHSSSVQYLSHFLSLDCPKTEIFDLHDINPKIQIIGDWSLAQFNHLR